MRRVRKVCFKLIESHPSLREPTAETIVWKYLTFDKFLYLLQEKALWFSDISQFNDPLEGKYVFPETISSRGLTSGLPFRLGRSATPEEKARYALLNCWQMGPTEDALMWGMYVGEKLGVVLKTNYQKLKSSILCSDVYAGEVTYSTDRIVPANANSFEQYFVKHSGYSSERELRLATPNLVDSNGNYSIGKSIDVDLSKLVDEIRVSPFATDWQIRTISKLVNQYAVPAPVVKSELLSPPIN